LKTGTFQNNNEPYQINVVHIFLGVCVAILDSYSKDTKKNWNNNFCQETKQCSSICNFIHSLDHTFL